MPSLEDLTGPFPGGSDSSSPGALGSGPLQHRQRDGPRDAVGEAAPGRNWTGCRETWVPSQFCHQLSMVPV